MSSASWRRTIVVPPGPVVTATALDIDGWEAAARSRGATRFVVRSSGVAEDLPDASYAGLSTGPRSLT